LLPGGKKIYFYVFLISACTLPLGLQSGKIPDLDVTASSHLSQYRPSEARMNSMKHFGWCAGKDDQNAELIIDLGKV